MGVRAYVAAIGGLGLLVIALFAGASSVSADPNTILEFHSMSPVTGPFVGSANPQRGLNGGGLPWMIDSAHGQLQSDGTLEIQVDGLVLANDPSVPAALRGTNPVPSFRAVVSCLVASGSSVGTSNVATGPFPASKAGDAKVETAVMLPRHCVAPEIFVTSPTEAWFAVTGT